MILRITFLVLFLASSLHAEVVRIEVKNRADLLSPKTFGSAGGYEKLSGKMYFAVDPKNSANLIVVDIDKAPRNASGKVEFSSDFYLIKPKDINRGNGTVLYEVSNRGGKGMLGFFNFASGSLDPQTASDVGDGFLLEQGFTLLWVGWQFDVPNREGTLRAYVPIATFTGWNLFNERSGPVNVMSTTTGSFIPFPRTRAEREKTNDPRPSLEERYGTRDHYLDLVLKSANELASKGYLIKEDVPRIVQQAGTRWDFVMGASH